MAGVPVSRDDEEGLHRPGRVIRCVRVIGVVDMATKMYNTTNTNKVTERRSGKYVEQTHKKIERKRTGM